MLNGNESTLANLRLIAGIKAHEYIQTDCDGNILSYLGHNFISCVTSTIYGENFNSTMKCLRKLYVDEMPKLLEELFKTDSDKELQKIGVLLEKSIEGLINLKVVYQKMDEEAHINTVIDDFAQNQLERVVEYLVPKGMATKEKVIYKVKKREKKVVDGKNELDKNLNTLSSDTEDDEKSNTADDK